MRDAATFPPGPPLPTAVQTLLWIRRPTQLMQRCRHQYGPTFAIKLPPWTMVVLADPEDIRKVFSAKPHEVHAGEVNRILRVLLGDHSVLLLDGIEHIRHRRLLMPSFHGDRLRSYGETMAGITRSVMQTWPQNEAFSLHPHTQDITLKVILRTVFGMEEGARMAELENRMKRMLSASENRAATLLMMYVSEHPEIEGRAPWKWLLRDRNRTDELLYREIAERRVDHELADRHDVLSMLLRARDEAGEGLTDVELRDELMTALAAGHETTATALAWAFERILSNRAVYERLRDEVRSAVNGSSVDPNRLAELSYLDATIKEVLRLRPVLPLVGRVLKKPFSLGGYDLPEGTAVAPCIYLAQRNPAVYPEPEEFRPERFVDAQPDPSSWLPFGGGMRRCVGAAFATYEMKIVLGTMLATCDFELAQRAPARVVRRAITFWPEKGTRVRAVRAP